MTIHDKIKPYIKHFKILTLTGSGIASAYYLISNTHEHICNIVNTNVLKTEKKCAAEYIYIEDPLYNTKVLQEYENESKRSFATPFIWRNLKPSLTWRLLLFCRFGNPEQRDIALEQLASFKNNKEWDCLKLAQALDMNTAVLLARTENADLRYFLPPPMHIRREAKSSELLCFKFRDILLALQLQHSHICIEHFLSKYFVNVQEQMIEVDTIPVKPDRMSDRDLCLLSLKALYHHLSIFGIEDYNGNIPTFISTQLIPRIAELFLRYPNDSELDAVILKLLTVLSIDKRLLVDFFQNGLIRELSRLIRLNDNYFSSSAAVCLSNLSGECTYKPGLFLLHPIYRTSAPPVCDTILVHGLGGGVFVTWRQRDRKCTKYTDIAEEVYTTDKDCDPCKDEILDAQLKTIMEEVIDSNALLANMEVVLQDIPEKALRESHDISSYIAHKNRISLIQEKEDKCQYSACWPKDWLPKDCKNLRILGVNYWSSVSEWLETCPLLSSDIESRAFELADILKEAEVGVKQTPVVWLAHSMGGLIVKQLLVSAAESGNEDEKICDNTKALLFFSTPHKGSSVANMPRAAAAVFWPSTDVKQLQENSPLLLELNKNFLNVADKYKWETISFSESKPTLVTAFKVPFHFVKPESADLGRGTFYQLPLDHLSICKPASRQSMLYKTVLDVILYVSENRLNVKHSHYFWDIYLFWLHQKLVGISKQGFKILKKTISELPWSEKVPDD